jgi:hypothetical protein
MACVQHYTKELLEKEGAEEMDDVSQLERNTRVFNEGVHVPWKIDTYVLLIVV